MASGAWSKTPAWGTPTEPVFIPSFEDVMKEQEKEKSTDNSVGATRSKRNADAWLKSEPWYSGKVNRNRRRNQEESVSGREGQGQRKPTESAPVSSSKSLSPASNKTQSNITVVNVHMKDLNISGYRDLEDWLKHPDHLYIGRDMTRYVPGAAGSKWHNPFKSKQVGRENSVIRFKEYILTDETIHPNGKTLFESLGELKGKSLGCWCHPERCHGHILRELVEQYCQ